MSVLSDLQAELQTKSQRLSTLETQVSGLEAELATIQQQYEDECNRLKGLIATLDATIADLEARIATVQQKIDNLKSQLGIT